MKQKKTTEMQLQQEAFTLEAHVVDQSGLAGAVQAINNLVAAQGKKDTPRRERLWSSEGILWQRKIFDSGRRRLRRLLLG